MYPPDMKSTHILLASALAVSLVIPLTAPTSAAGAASAGKQTPQRPAPAQYPALPSETPATFEPVTDSFDYVKRDVMIPMRDGVQAAHRHPRAEGRAAARRSC